MSEYPRCRDCHEAKPVDEFFLEASGRRRPNCRPCVIKAQRLRREERRAAAMGAAHEGFNHLAAQFCARRFE